MSGLKITIILSNFPKYATVLYESWMKPSFTTFFIYFIYLKATLHQVLYE